MVRRLVPLLGVVALAVVAGVVLDHSGIAEELAHLDEADRWSEHHDPDSVSAVAPAPDGGLWAGTGAAGLVRWHADGSYQRHLTDRLAGQVVQDVVAADDGTVWAAVSSFGEDPSSRLLRFDGDEWRAEPILGGEADDGVVHSLAADEDAAWVATHQGLARFDGDEWTTLTAEDGSPLRARDVVTDGDGVVWAAVGGEQRRVLRWGDEPSSTAWPIERQGDDGRPLTNEAPLALGADGSVWIATMEHTEDDAVRVQPWRWADGEWVAATPGFGAPYSQLQAFAIDDGRPWVAMGLLSDARGRESLWHFDGQRWQRFGRSDGLPHTLMSSLAVDEDGVVWAGTIDGVGRFADGEWTRYATGEGPGNDFLIGLATGEEGTVWTAGAFGVSRFDGQGWTSWGADDGLAATNRLHDVAVGPDGGAWAVTERGVFRFDGREWTSLHAGGEVDDNHPESLAVGPDGAVWVGADRRVGRFDGERWTTWTADDDGLPRSAVRSLAVGDGDVWAATQEGVAHFDGDGWEKFTIEDGLPASSVNAVALGTGPRVWAGTKRGLARFDGQRWAHADSDETPLAFEGNPPAARAEVHALTTGDDGTVWAATREALSAFDGRQWHTTPLDVAVGRVRALAVDDTAAWVASPEGLARFDRDAE